MKTITISFKRTHWFKALVAFLTCLLFLVFPSCQKDELNQDSLADITPLASSKGVKPKQGRVKDFERNVYKTVQIGDQWWMAENLNSLKYSDGTIINEVYAYNNDEINTEEYGRLYTWNAAMKGAATEKAQGVCPVGWHIPSVSDWVILEDFLGGYQIAGGKMKESGTTHWLSPNTGATNSSGFTSLPSGFYFNGNFLTIGQAAFYWASSFWIDNFHAAFRATDFQMEGLYNCCTNPLRTDALSVRCIKDN
jgi:uncharacterized protein (TIGR02145 family)